MRNALAFILLATALACALPAVPAQAQSTRTFVSGAGSDSNNCAEATPCRTFQAAYTAVAAGGEIDVLTPAGYGALTISHAVSIQGHGYAGISVPSTGNETGITITAGTSDVVNLRGLLIDGAGVGAYGIQFTIGAVLNVQDCVVRNVTNTGIYFNPQTASQLFVSDTIVSDDSGYGILVQPAGAVSIAAYLNHVEVDNNEFGVYAVTGAYVAIRNSAINRNSSVGLIVNGGVFDLSHSMLTGNGSGWFINSGTLNTTGDNLIDQNTSNTGTLSTLGYQ
jgi:hypothetical protein